MLLKTYYYNLRVFQNKNSFFYQGAWHQSRRRQIRQRPSAPSGVSVWSSWLGGLSEEEAVKDPKCKISAGSLGRRLSWFRLQDWGHKSKSSGFYTRFASIAQLTLTRPAGHRSFGSSFGSRPGIALTKSGKSPLLCIGGNTTATFLVAAQVFLSLALAATKPPPKPLVELREVWLTDPQLESSQRAVLRLPEGLGLQGGGIGAKDNKPPKSTPTGPTPNNPKLYLPPRFQFARSAFIAVSVHAASIVRDCQLLLPRAEEDEHAKSLL